MKFSMLAALADPAPSALEVLSGRLKGILTSEPKASQTPSSHASPPASPREATLEIELPETEKKTPFRISLPSAFPLPLPSWRSRVRLEDQETSEAENDVEDQLQEIELSTEEPSINSLGSTHSTMNSSLGTIVATVLKAVCGLVFFGGLLSIFIGFFIKDSFAQRGVMSFLEWAQNLPYMLASLALASIYGVCLSLLLPMTPFNLASGLLFGLWRGMLSALFGYFLGQTLTYWLANTLMKSWIEGKLQEKEKQYKVLRAVRLALASNGFKLIIISHLSPIFPAGLLNYLFSLSPLPFAYYTVGSLIGVIPSIGMMVTVGSALHKLSAMWSGESSGSTTQTILYGLAAILVTCLVVAAFGYFAKKELQKLQQDDEEEDNEAQQETDEGDHEVQNQSLITEQQSNEGEL